MDLDFLSPVKQRIDALESPQNFGRSIGVHTPTNGVPDLSGVQIAIFGVQEDRNAPKNKGCGDDLYPIRKCLYELFFGNWNISVVDLGNIKKGAIIADTYFAVNHLITYLLKKNIIPIIIGGSQDITYANYCAYYNLEQVVNLVSVDSRFDIGTPEELSATSFLSKILTKEPSNLFNYSNIGYQTYFNSQEEIDLVNRLFFDAYRLGDLKNLELVEPVMRDADIVSIDIGAVRQSEAPANKNTSPNGFYGEEICTIARYAGISDKVSSFGIYEYNVNFDENFRTAHLIAQMIWYFIEGVNHRSNDYPFSTKKKYKKFTVLFEKEDINFYKSDKSGRWWMDITINADTKNSRQTLIPCTYGDYTDALANKIPERWYKAYHRIQK